MESSFRPLACMTFVVVSVEMQRRLVTAANLDTELESNHQIAESDHQRGLRVSKVQFIRRRSSRANAQDFGF
jgi:hypothetical protein